MVGPVVTTTRELLVEYGLSDGEDVLLSIVALQENLTHFGIKCSPSLGEQGLDDERVLSSEHSRPVEAALEVIASGETEAVEFKSTLLLDLREFSRNPDSNPTDFKNDDLTHAVLKTIAAFCNCRGGTLFVGVADDGEICGLQNDYIATNPARRDYDGWIQFFMRAADSQFIDGRSVNSYVSTSLFTHDGKQFVEMRVAPRNNLAFLRKKDNQIYELYLRQNTRSIAISFHQIQTYFQLTRLF